MKSSILIPAIKQERLFSKEKQPSQQKSIQDNRQSFMQQKNTIDTIQLSRMGPMFPPTFDMDDPRIYDSDAAFAFTPENYTEADQTFIHPDLTPPNYTPGNSTVLRNALILQGNVAAPDDDHQAHHIIEARDDNAADARHLLDLAGIDLDSPINGVFLPRGSYDGINATIHNGSHVWQYGQTINSIFIEKLHDMNINSEADIQALGQEAFHNIIVEILKAIRIQLLNVDLPLNLASDPPVDEDGTPDFAPSPDFYIPFA